MPRKAVSENDISPLAHERSRRGRRLSPQIEDRIDDLWAHGSQAKQIYRVLASDPELGPDCPDIRTIQRRLHSRRGRSARWSVATASPDVSAVVLAVIPDVVQETKGAITWVTEAEALMIARLKPLITGLGGWDVYLIARAYTMREAAGRQAEDLDAILAYQPWRSSEALLAYGRAISLGYVPAAPGYITEDLRLAAARQSMVEVSSG